MVRPVLTELRSRFHVSIDFGAFCCKLRRGRDLAGAVSLASHRDAPCSIPGKLMLDLWWTKWLWGRISMSTSVSPAYSRSTKSSGLVQ
jgi:hypothetical protein